MIAPLKHQRRPSRRLDWAMLLTLLAWAFAVGWLWAGIGGGL